LRTPGKQSDRIPGRAYKILTLKGFPLFTQLNNRFTRLNAAPATQTRFLAFQQQEFSTT
jgi:hypothetical protein